MAGPDAAGRGRLGSCALAPLVALLATAPALPCTILSGQDPNGVVWVGNNEDWSFDFETRMNVIVGAPGELSGVAFVYDFPEAEIQGGLNEAGLFFDFNSLPSVDPAKVEGWAKKKDFPGGREALFLHVLRHARTVAEVLALNEQYRFPPLLQAQMHLADSSGALAVISASGVRTSHGGSQVSTNWDVCGPSGTAREHACWRYPIAKRILSERGVSRESIRDVLAPVVRAFNAWQASGAAAGVKALRAAGGPPERLAESLHELHWNALNQVNRYADGRTFFEAWLAATGGKDPATDFYAGLTALTNGEAEKAEASFARQAEVDLAQGDGPGYGKPAAGFLRALRGERPADANAHFELEGHHDAKFVGVYNITNNTVRAFLLRTKTGWARDFALPPGKIQYAFMVDGEILLDPKNPVTEEATYDGDAEWVGHRKLNATVIAPAPRPER